MLAPVQRYYNSTLIDELLKNKQILMAPKIEFNDVIIRRVWDLKKDVQLKLQVINTEREQQLGIGTKYNIGKLKEAECALHDC